MTSFFFSRSSLSKNNNNDDDSKETLSSPSALRYAKKKNNTTLLVMKARTRIFCTIISQQKIRKRQETKKRFIFSLISIRTVYSTQYLRKKRHQKHLLSSERHATRQQQLRHKTFRGANRSSRALEVTCACTYSAFFQQQKSILTSYFKE